MLNFENYEDLIEELSLCTQLSEDELKFVEDLLLEEPIFLSDKQADWLENLKEKYLL